MLRKTAVFVVTVVLFVVSAFLTSAQDENPLPEPTGPYDVGRTIYHLIDEDRPEILTEDEDDVRELVVYAFYPADVPEGAEPAPYLNEAMIAAHKENIDDLSPAFETNYSKSSHSYEDVPILESDAPYPVIVFMPGLDRMPWNYYSKVEELASHGYVVLLTYHPYHAYITIFPDGRVVMQMSDPITGPDNMIPIWTMDAQFVLDELVNLNENDDLLAGMLDLEQIGMAGHSIGGTTSLWMAENDERIDAVVSLDGYFYVDSWGECDLCTEMLETPIDIPVLIMSINAGEKYPLPEAGVIADGTFLWLVGVNHMQFSDIGLLWNPGDYEFNLGQTINSYLSAFFDEKFKGVEGAISGIPEEAFAKLSEIE